MCSLWGSGDEEEEDRRAQNTNTAGCGRERGCYSTSLHQLSNQHHIPPAPTKTVLPVQDTHTLTLLIFSPLTMSVCVYIYICVFVFVWRHVCISVCIMHVCLSVCLSF